MASGSLLQCLLNTPWKYILLMPIFYLSGESPSSKFQCDFRKGYSTQDCILTMVETCKKATDQGKEFRPLLTDISKAFDCLAHDLLIAECHVHGCSIDSLNLNDYLTERKQRVKMNNQFSSWMDTLFGVLQGSILGPLLFNIFYMIRFFSKLILTS